MHTASYIRPGKTTPPESPFAANQQASLTFFRTPFTQSGEAQCKPRSKIAFAKLHKTAGTSVQNILLRYGLAHDLNVVLPASGNYVALSAPFRRASLRGTPWEAAGLKHYDLFCLHGIWDYAEVTSTLGPGAAYVTAMRDPVERFISSWDYYEVS